MNTPYTPGPWHTMVTREPNDDISAIGIRDDYNLFVAAVEPHDEMHADALANARLIAAAPDLLAALKAMLTIYAEGECEDVHPDTAEEMARAAIAKAVQS